VKFVWSPECNRAFEELKSRFTEHPLLRHYNHETPTRIETDASDTGIAAVLMQWHEVAKLYHPVAYVSRRLTDPESRYEVHDRKMLAVKYATEGWRPLLLSCVKGFDVLTDNVSGKCFMSTKDLNQRQVRWAEQKLADFWFRLSYRPGKANDQPDALSRRDDAGLAGEAFQKGQERPARSFFQPHHLRLAVTERPYRPDLLMSDLGSAQLADPQLRSTMDNHRRNPRYTVVNGLLLFHPRKGLRARQGRAEARDSQVKT